MIQKRRASVAETAGDRIFWAIVSEKRASAPPAVSSSFASIRRELGFKTYVKWVRDVKRPTFTRVQEHLAGDTSVPYYTADGCWGVFRVHG